MSAEAFILIQTDNGKAGDVAKAIRGMEGVTLAEDVTGPYDVIVRAEAPDVDALGRPRGRQRAVGRRHHPDPDLPGGPHLSTVPDHPSAAALRGLGPGRRVVRAAGRPLRLRHRTGQGRGALAARRAARRLRGAGRRPAGDRRRPRAARRRAVRGASPPPGATLRSCSLRRRAARRLRPGQRLHDRQRRRLVHPAAAAGRQRRARPDDDHDQARRRRRVVLPGEHWPPATTLADLSTTWRAHRRAAAAAGDRAPDRVPSEVESGRERTRPPWPTSESSATISRLLTAFPATDEVLVGPGDDAAEVRVGESRAGLHRHDGRRPALQARLVPTARDVGRRAAAQCLSDLNAMGGTATALLSASPRPRDLPVDWLLDGWQPAWPRSARWSGPPWSVAT